MVTGSALIFVHWVDLSAANNLAAHISILVDFIWSVLVVNSVNISFTLKALLSVRVASGAARSDLVASSAESLVILKHANILTVIGVVHH